MNEQRLIDANALAERIYNEGRNQAEQSPQGKYDEAVQAYADCFAMAKSAPTIDPVKRGQWTNGYFQDIICTACLHPSPVNEKTRYCPNCGAKMDKEAPPC